MSDFSKFRTAVSGFNRTDVVNYIESTSIEHQKALRKLTDERDKLAAENARLQVELAGLQKRLEQAQADNDALSGQVNALAQEGSDLAEQLKKAEEAQQELLTRPDPQPSEPVPQPEEPEESEEPEAAQEPSLTEKELTAYRRAEQTERNAAVRARRIYAQLSNLCEDARTRYMDSGEEIAALAADLSTGLSRLQELFGHLDGRLVAGGGQDDRPLELFQQLLAFGRSPVEACLDDFGIEAGPGHQVDLLFKRHVAGDGQFPARGQGSAFVEVGHAAAVVVQEGGPAAGRAAVAVGAGQGDGQLFRSPDFEGKRKIRGRTVAFEQGTAGTVRHGHANSRKRGGQGRPPYSEERVSGRQRACNQLSGRGRGRRSLASDCRAWGRLAL